MPPLLLLPLPSLPMWLMLPQLRRVVAVLAKPGEDHADLEQRAAGFRPIPPEFVQQPHERDHGVGFGGVSISRQRVGMVGADC